LTVIGWKDWIGGCTYLYGHSMPWITDGHPDAIDIAEAEAFGTAMAEHSWKVSDGWPDRIPKLPSPEAIDAIYGKFAGIKQEQAGDVSNFLLKVNAEKCIGCGLCAQACYFGVIDASVKPPVFKRPEDCVGTMAGSSFCSGICPTGAIEVGMSGIPTGELGGQRGQSSFPTGSIAGAPKNPNRDDDRMKAGDFLEATGRFRRLVPEEDLNWNITWEEAVGDPPRYKEIP
jgi:ferredoxin